MTKKPFRILIVDDYEPWRRFASSIFQAEPGLQVVDEAYDGAQAIQKAQDLQPDLILLDIGLPLKNGIEAARQITRVAPSSKILFASENRSMDVVREALNSGGLGYLLKADAGSQLIPAVRAVLAGNAFLSESLASENSNPGAGKRPEQTCHRIDFYTDEDIVLNRAAGFIASALRQNNPVIVVATLSHRDSIVQKLRSQGLNIASAQQRGRYIGVDAAAMLSRFMVNGVPDPVRFKAALGKLIDEIGMGRKVAIFGEAIQLLLEQGNAEGALAIETLTNELARQHPIDVLCACHLAIAKNSLSPEMFEQISAEHVG